MKETIALLSRNASFLLCNDVFLFCTAALRVCSEVMDKSKALKDTSFAPIRVRIDIMNKRNTGVSFIHCVISFTT